MEKNSNEKVCSTCGHCGSCGSCGNTCQGGMCGGCHGMGGHSFGKKVLMVLILLAIFCLGTEVGELKSMKRSYHYRNSGYGMMGNYDGGYGQGMMSWWGLDEEAPIIVQPQSKEVIVNNKAATTPAKQ